MTVTRPGPTGARATIDVLRRNPAFARVYAAQLISYAGDWFSTVALLDLVLHLTGSVVLDALVFTVATIPFALISPLAGAIADHFDRRRVMIIADVVRACLALTLLLADSRSTLWIAFVGFGAIGVVTAFFEPAASAATPNLVPPEDLAIANVLQGSAWGMMLAVGAAIGGVVTAAFGRNVAFITDAGTFLISAALLLSVRHPFHAALAQKKAGITIIRDIKEMLRFARDEPRVRALIICKGGFGVGAGSIALIAVMAKDVLHSGVVGIAVIMSARGLGAVIGPFLFRRIFGDSDRGLFRAIAVAFAVFGLGYVVFGLAPALWLAAIGAGIAHIGGGGQWTMSTIGPQRFTPDHIRGRIFSADYMLVELTIGTSILLAGWLADRFGVRVVAVSFAALQLLWAAVWSTLTRADWPEAS